MNDAPVTHLLYLHGFRSSPKSTKARMMAAWMREHRPGVIWACPQLPPSPCEAMACIDAAVAAWPLAGMAVIGSSLGGFYATVLAERNGCRAVVLNPAVDPARDLADRVGEQKSWHDDDTFFFRPGYIDELRAMAPPPSLTRPDRYFAVIAKGDELLSWREMKSRYAGSDGVLIEGSDHALSDFADHLPAVVRFLQLGAARSAGSS
ncbi:MAG TPA: YqiA/YcfP family alpha/beta fold hydrolase [Caldimonas sp.]|nr:YqiA/YcfP family alpha/beta fold hydrolase [Caldimonas sp.]